MQEAEDGEEQVEITAAGRPLEQQFSRKVNHQFKKATINDRSHNHERWVYDLVEQLAIAKVCDFMSSIDVYAPSSTIETGQLIVPLLGVYEKGASFNRSFDTNWGRDTYVTWLKANIGVVVYEIFAFKQTSTIQVHSPPQFCQHRQRSLSIRSDFLISE